MKKTVETETASGFKMIHKHQTVFVLTDVPGKTWKGVILALGKTESVVRYNEDEILRERKVANIRLVPVRFKSAKVTGEPESEAEPQPEV